MPHKVKILYTKGHAPLFYDEGREADFDKAIRKTREQGTFERTHTATAVDLLFVQACRIVELEREVKRLEGLVKAKDESLQTHEGRRT